MNSNIPFDQKEGYLWLDNKIVDWKDAKIHVLNHGLNYGSSIFEGERVYNGKIFKSQEHIDRFFESAKYMDMKLPVSKEELFRAKELMVIKNNITNGYMKTLAWRGCEQMTIAANLSSIHLLIAVWPFNNYFNIEAGKGLKICVSRWKRPSADSFPYQAKVGGGYVINTLAKHEAMAQGFDDAILLDHRDYIAEGSSANLFLVKNGELYTPIADCFLNGITRQTIIELATENNINVNEVRIKLTNLSNYQEAFFVGSAAGITPISSIADHKFKIGETVKKMIQLYNSKTSQ